MLLMDWDLKKQGNEVMMLNLVSRISTFAAELQFVQSSIVEAVTVLKKRSMTEHLNFIPKKHGCFCALLCLVQQV